MDLATHSAWRRLLSEAQLRLRAECDSPPQVLGPVWLHGGGRVVLGRGVVLDASELPIELYAQRGATLRIGNGVRIEGGASVEALREVTIGDGCALGALVKVLDCNHHSLGGDHYQYPPAVPVVLEPGVEVGAGAVVLPGAHLRRGAKVKPGVIVAGKPGSGRAEVPRWRPAKARWPVVKAERALGFLRGHWLFRGCGRALRIYAGGPIRLENQGTIALGSGVQFLGGMIPTELRVGPGATFEVGARTLLNYAAKIDVQNSVRIGQGCLFASQVQLTDATPDGPRPVTIGDEVWVAYGAKISGGVTIGDGAVIAAGAQVVSDVPPRAVAMGQPARCVPMSLLNPESRGEAAPAPRSS